MDIVKYVLGSLLESLYRAIIGVAVAVCSMVSLAIVILFIPVIALDGYYCQKYFASIRNDIKLPWYVNLNTTLFEFMKGALEINSVEDWL